MRGRPLSRARAPYKRETALRFLTAFRAWAGAMGLVTGAAILSGPTQAMSAGPDHQGSSLGASGYRTDPTILCDGFPQVDVKTAAGFCMGLVLDKSATDPSGNYNMLFPRTILPLPDSDDFIIADMGRWTPNKGRLWRLVKDRDGSYSLRILKRNLDRTHGLALGPDGLVYVGEAGRVFRFSPGQFEDTVETVLERLPGGQDGSKSLHPLTDLVFDKQGALIIGVGAQTDVCAQDTTLGRCVESSGPAPTASLWRYPRNPDGSYGPAFEVLAKGLRNSLGLVVTGQGRLYQAENAYDDRAPDRPYDEINLIEPTRTPGTPGHHGWPYCMDSTTPTPLWAPTEAFSCSEANPDYRPPVAVLPPHSAPLSLVDWQAGFAPFANGALVASLHGYAGAGHRILAFPYDDAGHLVADPDAAYLIDGAGTSTLQPFDKSRAGTALKRAVYLVTDWSAQEGVRPRGAPVGLAQARDGSIWIVEDHNKAILRLARADGDRAMARPHAFAKAAPLPRLTAATLAGLDTLAAEVLKPQCVACHQDILDHDNSTAVADALLRAGWIVPGAPGQSMLMDAISGKGVRRPMPPEAPLSTAEIDQIRAWIARSEVVD